MGSPIGRVAFSILMGLCAALALPDSVALGDDAPSVSLPAPVPAAAYPAAVAGEGPAPCPASEASAVDGVVSHLLGKVDPLFDLVASGGIAVALILAAMTWIRAGFPDKLAPDPSTQTSRFLNLGIALVFGLLLGIMQVAPAVPIPGRTLDGGLLWFARALGGFMAATTATFGRDVWTRGRGVVAEKKEAKIAAGMTTGQFRALRDDTEPKP